MRPTETPAPRIPNPWRKLALVAGLVLPLALAACDRSSQDGSAAATAAAEAQQQARQAEAERIAGAIEAVLTSDTATASIVDDTRHAATMRTIDTSACPADFRAAYLDHVFAWERYAKVQKAIADLNSDDSVGVTLAFSALNGLLGGGGTPILDHIHASQRLNELRDEASAQVRATYERVQVLATGYGAALPGA